jgi:hypothetical protein
VRCCVVVSAAGVQRDAAISNEMADSPTDPGECRSHPHNACMYGVRPPSPPIQRRTALHRFRARFGPQLPSALGVRTGVQPWWEVYRIARPLSLTINLAVRGGARTLRRLRRLRVRVVQSPPTPPIHHTQTYQLHRHHRCELATARAG